MDELEESARAACAEWVNRTLKTFREEAQMELNGTAFAAIRPSFHGEPGPRVMLAVCCTGLHELSLVEKRFNFVDDGAAAYRRIPGVWSAVNGSRKKRAIWQKRGLP